LGRTAMRTKIHCSYDIAHPDVWYLDQPYTRETSIGTVRVSMGFKWDGASVPRVLWNIIPPWGSYSGAALVHDWLYRRHRLRSVTNREITKEEADRVFYELMLEDGVWKIRAYTMWLAVALCGRKAWSQNKDDQDTLVEAALASA
jgi:hypothetical protein